ncbi:MAG TPA: class I SAM-dependent methyltransferase, partial [Thiothrix sp.]|nr:class I SAM-dependent methyltransferase [Thiothrix sp.]
MNDYVLSKQKLPLPLDLHLKQFPLFGRWFLSMLNRIHEGELHVFIANQHYRCGQTDSDLQATIRINRPLSLAKKAVLRGDLGFAESYMAGDWQSDNLSDLLTLLLRNREHIGKRFNGYSGLRLGSRFYHYLRKNSILGSKKNIEQHYDLGNDFYQAWLDQSMTYSSGLFLTPDDDLHTAQQHKYQRILQQLGAKKGDAVLEIGCGWGGFAEHAIQAGQTVHGITLSQEQCAYAQQRLQPYGDQAHIEIRDYRHLTQQYDHIVSIEMFEAVGEQYWETYFATIQQSLKSGGKAVLQIITIGDEWFESYRRKADFIQRYIFPGGLLPSLEKLEDEIAKTDLHCLSTKRFGQDYARTLAIWDQQFVQALPQLEQLGYDQRFARMWRYYFSY